MTNEQQSVRELSMNKYRPFIEAFKAIQNEAHKTAKAKGWWDERNELIAVADAYGIGAFAQKAIKSQMLALMHSEISEGLEGLRKDLKDDKCPEFDMETVELADTFIRMLDYAAGFDLPLAEAIAAKLQMNATREYKHGGKSF
jgi:hypothetical protein